MTLKKRLCDCNELHMYTCYISELGCGTGLVGLTAACLGARVTLRKLFNLRFETGNHIKRIYHVLYISTK